MVNEAPSAGEVARLKAALDALEASLRDSDASPEALAAAASAFSAAVKAVRPPSHDTQGPA